MSTINVWVYLSYGSVKNKQWKYGVPAGDATVVDLEQAVARGGDGVPPLENVRVYAQTEDGKKDEKELAGGKRVRATTMTDDGPDEKKFLFVEGTLKAAGGGEMDTEEDAEGGDGKSEKKSRKRKAEAEAAGRAKQAVFSSEKVAEFVKALVSIEGAELPTTLDELKAFLQAPLLKKLPLPRDLLDELPAGCFDNGIDAADYLHKLHRIVESFIDSQKDILGQCGLHVYLDKGWQTLWGLFNQHVPIQLEFYRDATDNITTDVGKRPDFLCYVKDCLVFRGEEEDADFEKAKDDVKNKLVWNPAVLGGIKYLLAYAATSTQLDISALTSTGRTTLIGPLNVTTKLCRGELLRFSVNAYRLFRLLLPLVPEGSPKLGAKVAFKHGKVVVSYKSFHVTKTCPSPVNLEGPNGLRVLYQKLAAHSCPHLVIVKNPEVAGDKLMLHIEPVGCKVREAAVISEGKGHEGERMQEEQRLKCIVRAVLDGLAFLHGLDYAHNDIRMGNVLVHKGDVFFLGDLESACKIGEKLQSPLESMAPEVAQGKPVSVQSDLYLVGKLLQTASLSDGGRQFRAALMAAEPADRPESAMEALKHGWLRV